MKPNLLLFFLTLLPQVFLSQTLTHPELSLEKEEIMINQFVSGTLLSPSVEKPPLVVLIQGSGPTDRDGNQSFMKNDSFKKLAQELGKNGIASFRYDKRIMKMGELGIKEEEIRFDDFITDAVSVLDYFREREGFGKIIVLGHSQGSLVGMLGAKGRADAFISLAGVAQPIDSVLISQLELQMPQLKENAVGAFREMREKGSTTSYHPLLASLFRPSIQPFMLSWMKHDPAEILSTLEIPVLIINGTKDLQASQEEAHKLKEAKPNAHLVLLEKMNHILREIDGDDLENSKSYNEPNRPLHPELVPALTTFIQAL